MTAMQAEKAAVLTWAFNAPMALFADARRITAGIVMY